MDGATAQMICLAIRGSGWLLRPEGPPPELQGSSTPSFRFSRLLRFDRENGTAPWLASLRERDVDRLYLDIPGAFRTAHAGRGLRLLGTRAEAPCESWEHEAVHLGNDEPGGRIWDELYHRRTSVGARVVNPDVTGATAELRAALAELVAYTKKAGLEAWGEIFAEALAVGAADDPKPKWYPDIDVPEVMTLDARRVLAMAATANVFRAGMGSWDEAGGYVDRGLRERFTDLTERGRQAVLRGLIAGTNAPLRVG